MKKKILLVVILATSLLFSGCWDYIEYENMAMVSAMGIDFNKDTKLITVTVEIMRINKSSGPGQKSDKSKPFSTAQVLTAADVTMTDAVEKIQQGICKRLFYGYQQVFIISEDAAKNIMDEIIGLLDRTPEIRTTSYLVITSQKPENILSTMDPDTSEPSSRNIYNLAQISSNTGNSFTISIKDFAQALAIGGIEPVVPRVITKTSDNPEEKEKSQNQNDESRQFVQFDKSKEGHHIIEGLAAFQGEKFKGWLNAKESKGWAWITGKSLKTYESTKSSDKTFTKDILTFLITKSKNSIKPKFDNNEPSIYIDVHVEADLRKGIKSLDLLTPDVISSMEKQLSDSIHSDIEAAIEKGQKQLKSDIFGFGFSFYRKYPMLWHSKYEQSWKEIFPDISVSVNVDAKIISTGTTIRRFIFK